GRSLRYSRMRSARTRAITTTYFNILYRSRLSIIVTPAILVRGIRQIVFAPSWERIRTTATRRGIRRAAIDTARGKIPTVNRFGQDARDFLRQRAMFRRRAPAERLFQLIRNVCANEYSFAIGHVVGVSLSER